MRPQRLALSILVLGVLAVSGPAALQQVDRRLPVQLASGDASSNRRLALVIGNDAYPEMRLANAVNDAKALGAALRDVGFDVQVETNVTLRDIGRAIGAFVGRLGAGDVALFYYSGHGIQVVGENYLLPVDFEARTPDEASDQAYPISRVQTRIADKGAGLSVLVLDACRNNPFLRGRGVGTRGWAAMQGGGRTFIAFATAPGETASDNPGGGNGLFTSHFLEVLRQPGLTLDQVFAEVGGRVRAESNQRQDPWVSASAGVGAQFVFRRALAMPPSVSPDPDLAPREELELWESIKGSTNVEVFEEYVRQYPTGKYRPVADSRIKELRGKPAISVPPPDPKVGVGSEAPPAFGAAPVLPPKGSIFVLAAGPGSAGTHGVFTAELLEELKTPGRSAQELFRRVRLRVYTRTGGRQVPWVFDNTGGEIILGGSHGVRGAALVVGMGAYPAAPLRSATNDARAVASALRGLGFETTELVDGKRVGLIRAVTEFRKRLEPDTAALFFYSGHGVAVEGENYLVPIDFAGVAAMDVKISGLRLNAVLDELATSRVSIVVLDMGTSEYSRPR